MITPLGSVTKDPDADLPYTIDWTTWLADIGPLEDLATVAWDVDDLMKESESNTTKMATVQLSGGVSGKKTVRCRITTGSGYTDDRSFFVFIRER